MNISDAKKKLDQIKNKSKYNIMIQTAAIITRLLEPYQIKPIIVGGLSVEIYTQSQYTTRDIDFVSDGYHIIQDILFSLGFQKENRHFYHPEIEVAIEIPDNHLAGSYEKVTKVYIDKENFVYLISIEDIILDRVRAAVHWKSEEDAIWAFRLLASHFEDVDQAYLMIRTETKNEIELLKKWIDELNRND